MALSYDVLDRQTVRIDANNTSAQARTETDYDIVNRVLEVRSPRFFDTADQYGEDAANETWVYNARGLVTSHTESTGAQAATESFTYDLKRRPLTHTDFRGKVWETHYDSCCDKSSASENPVGHGRVRNMDALGRTVHTATISTVNDHLSDLLNPVNGQTLMESTSRYDGRGRVVASTVWLTARGAIDRNNPPIAGLNGVSLSDGLTIQYLYDENLFDEEGLDSTAGVSPLIPITDIADSPISLSAAITKTCRC